MISCQATARFQDIYAAPSKALGKGLASNHLVHDQAVQAGESQRLVWTCSWCELQVVELSGLLKSKRGEVDEMLAAAHAKDRENSKLWEQVRPGQFQLHRHADHLALMGPCEDLKAMHIMLFKTGSSH